MAIYSAVPPPAEHATSGIQVPATPPQPQQSATGIDIDAWTVSALQSLSVSPVARGTGTPLTIPLDEEANKRNVNFVQGVEKPTETPRRPPSRRDSMKRREALLKGNEGSRQRRRWENDRLMGVPNAQPPQPHDWEPHPTHRTHNIPYSLAQFWDLGLRQRVETKTTNLAVQRKKQQLQTGSATGLGVGEVSRDLRESSKRSPIVKSWVRALEEPVRMYLMRCVEEEDREGVDSEDEEIVFVGRKKTVDNGAAGGWKMARREVERETVDQGMVFDSFGDQESAAFKRWLTHSISDYYGLESRSVMLTNPSRKAVYVGLKKAHQRNGLPMKKVPKPLWELCC